MKMLKTIPVFILLFTGYLCNAQDDVTPDFTTEDTSLVPAKGGTEKSSWETSPTFLRKPANETQGSDHVPAERSLPTLVVAGVSTALVLLCILIVAIFWYAWKKSQVFFIEGLAPAMIIEVFKKVQCNSIPSPTVRLECPYETLRCLRASRSGLLREQCRDSSRAAASPSGRKENPLRCK